MSIGEAARESVHALCVLILLLAGLATTPIAAAGADKVDPCGTLTDESGAAGPCHGCRPLDVILPAPPLHDASRVFTRVCHETKPGPVPRAAPRPPAVARGPPTT